MKKLVERTLKANTKVFECCSHIEPIKTLQNNEARMARRGGYDFTDGHVDEKIRTYHADGFLEKSHSNAPRLEFSNTSKQQI